MLVRYAFGIAVLLSLLFTASPAWAVVRYTVTDLGTLGGATARPGDINNSGQIVGSSKASDGSDRAFLYENGRMTDLGSFPDTSWTCANGINDSGQIVGYSGSYALGAHGFLYENGELVDIGNLPSLKNCVPRDINSTGVITGYSYESTGNGAHGFIFYDDLQIDIGWPIDSYGRRYWGVIPNQINASGEIVGHVHTAVGRECPFLYSNGLWIVLEDLEARLARASGNQ